MLFDSVVKYLSGERGAATNAKTTDDTTALMVAAGLGHMDVVKYLAGERGAATDARTADGMEVHPDAKCPVSGSPKSTFKMHAEGYFPTEQLPPTERLPSGTCQRP